MGTRVYLTGLGSRAVNPNLRQESRPLVPEPHTPHLHYSGVGYFLLRRPLLLYARGRCFDENIAAYILYIEQYHCIMRFKIPRPKVYQEEIEQY